MHYQAISTIGWDLQVITGASSDLTVWPWPQGSWLWVVAWPRTPGWPALRWWVLASTGGRRAAGGWRSWKRGGSITMSENILNPLHAKYFRGNKNIYTFYVIPPYWHDTGRWNLSLNKVRTYSFYIVNIMGADVLVTVGARASVTMILTMLNWINYCTLRVNISGAETWVFWFKITARISQGQIS